MILRHIYIFPYSIRVYGLTEVKVITANFELRTENLLCSQAPTRVYYVYYEHNVGKRVKEHIHDQSRMTRHESEDQDC